MLLKVRQQGLELSRGRWLRSECWIVGRSRQSQVQLGRAAAEGHRRIEIDADMIAGELEGGFLGEVHGIVQSVHQQVLRERKWSASFKVALDFFDGPLPAVAFIRYESL